ncbi:MAG: toll/interleukin-1 receptor domain-containing protein [Caldilineaceae bacterium]
MLTGKQLHQIQEALLHAFPSRDMLAMLVRIELDETLDALADGANQRVFIFNLLTWAERTDRVADLIAGAVNQSPRTPALQQLAQDARTWGLTPPAAAPLATRPSPPATPPPATCIDIFLSYSRRDAAIMQRLHADLRSEGFAVWIDEGLEPGTAHWQTAIEEAIEQARCMVVILTPNAKRSHWVQSEIGFAHVWGRPIYPLLASGDERSAVPLGLINAQRGHSAGLWRGGGGTAAGVAQIFASRRRCGTASSPCANTGEPCAGNPNSLRVGGSAGRWFQDGQQRL